MSSEKVLVEVKISTLTPVMGTNDGNYLYRDSKDRYYTNNKKAVKAALLQDLESPLTGDVLNAMLVIAGINRKGGWDAMIEI